MIEPFVSLSVDIRVRAEWSLIERHFCALIYDRALISRKRRPVVLAFKEILTQFRAHFLQ